jgi:hypothetical protein
MRINATTPGSELGKRVVIGTYTDDREVAVTLQGGNRMRESRKYGSVRGARSNACPYRDPYLLHDMCTTHPGMC